MKCNVDKSVYMIFSPLNKRCFVTGDFPNFTLDDKCIRCVSMFKYLGHVITNSLNDADIEKDIF